MNPITEIGDFLTTNNITTSSINIEKNKIKFITVEDDIKEYYYKFVITVLPESFSLKIKVITKQITSICGFKLIPKDIIYFQTKDKLFEKIDELNKFFKNTSTPFSIQKRDFEDENDDLIEEDLLDNNDDDDEDSLYADDY